MSSAAQVLLNHAPRDSGFRCACGVWEVPHHISFIHLQHPEHQLDALKAAGYTLVRQSDPADEVDL